MNETNARGSQWSISCNAQNNCQREEVVVITVIKCFCTLFVYNCESLTQRDAAVPDDLMIYIRKPTKVT